MKTLVVCTDFSLEAENATHYAASMAKDKKYEVILFSLQNVSIHTQNSNRPAEHFYNQIILKQNQLLKKSLDLSTVYDIDIKCHFATGNFFDEIEKCIAETSAELVVLGMAEKSLEQDLLGNTTTKILHRLKIPTLAVPIHKKYEGFKNILFAYDILKDLNFDVLNQIYDFSKEFTSKIEIFNVGNELDEFNNFINDKDLQFEFDFDDIKLNFKTVKSNEVIKAIKEEINIINADLLIMIPHKYNFWGYILHRSKTSIMASGNNVPLLSIPI